MFYQLLGHLLAVKFTYNINHHNDLAHGLARKEDKLVITIKHYGCYESGVEGVLGTKKIKDSKSIQRVQGRFVEEMTPQFGR